MRTKKKDKKKVEVVNKVENCIFYGVKWDAPSLEVLASVARGLENLTQLFKSQNVEIKSLLHITNKEEI